MNRGLVSREFGEINCTYSNFHCPHPEDRRPSSTVRFVALWRDLSSAGRIKTTLSLCCGLRSIIGIVKEASLFPPSFTGGDGEFWSNRAKVAINHAGMGEQNLLFFRSQLFTAVCMPFAMENSAKRGERERERDWNSVMRAIKGRCVMSKFYGINKTLRIRQWRYSGAWGGEWNKWPPILPACFSFSVSFLGSGMMIIYECVWTCVCERGKMCWWWFNLHEQLHFRLRCRGVE